MLIETNLSLVRYAAARFKHRGPEEMGRVHVVRRALHRHIGGEIKRFFRDTSWALHVPRRLQEARVELSKARVGLSTRLGRSPLTVEPAEAHKASNGYGSVSPDAAVNGADDEYDTMLAAFIGVDEDRFELVEIFHSLAPLIVDLNERDRRLIHLRFVEERTQQDIADELGCSQMRVSRLISKVVARLREGLMATE
ncbi:sigma-70 family RNA polymerase sigma factor [Streptomyces sp. NPDC002795]|uniref:sigma-70 family RNA polymerase sigma factor n=1 Tax=Streptomyces sp. NPDC002795 TaxID=3364665 RepID=UPI00369202D9